MSNEARRVADLLPGAKIYVCARLNSWETLECHNMATGVPSPVSPKPDMGAGFCVVFLSEEEASKHCGKYGYITLVTDGRVAKGERYEH